MGQRRGLSDGQFDAERDTVRIRFVARVRRARAEKPIAALVSFLDRHQSNGAATVAGSRRRQFGRDSTVHGVSGERKRVQKSITYIFYNRSRPANRSK